MWEQIDAEWGEMGAPEGRDLAAAHRSESPLGRAQVPDDVAGMFAFLAGPDGGYITGQSFTVDGGLVPG